MNPPTAALASIAFCVLTACTPRPAAAATSVPPPLPALELSPYLGTWHQVAHYPNRFQSQCVADTTATYGLQEDGRLRVVNRCRTASGAIDEVVGVAKPRGNARVAGGRLQPASLAVSFLPALIRWLPVGWGDYDVVQLLLGGQVSIVSEPSGEYLWVLSRSPQLEPGQWQTVTDWLRDAGFDLGRLQRAP